MTEEEAKRMYRRLYSRLRRILNETSKIEESIFHMKDALNENFLINGKGLCKEQIETPISHIESVQNEIKYEVLPYLSDKMY